MTRLRKAGTKEVQREGYLRRVFGIGNAEYKIMLAAQDGKCAICRREPGAKRFCVDHDHKTQQIRGLLCYRCNYGLTWYSDQAERLEAAARYITAPPAVPAIGYRVAPPKVKKRRKRIKPPAALLRIVASDSGTGQPGTLGNTPDALSPL